MKPTREQIEAKFSELSDGYDYDHNEFPIQTMTEEPAVALVQWAISLQPEWVPIAQYPDKDIPLVMRWHKLWKCPVAVQHRRAYADNGCEWLGGTRDNTWPEEAFEPFFQVLPQPPTK